IDGRLDAAGAAWDPRVALGVVLAAGGYPGEIRTGDVIEGLDTPLPEHAKVFHAGTRLDEAGRVVTAGGRVLCATALGETVHEAQQRAYAAVETIRFEGGFCRRDIGWRAISRG
ncbi:MAG TPA: phosphoribosylamine--glycine ligase, partial [Chromatiales bacterium]|nr:phosphoribosylamine--glycine ligase [Chromatiales bacterium]